MKQAELQNRPRSRAQHLRDVTRYINRRVHDTTHETEEQSCFSAVWKQDRESSSRRGDSNTKRKKGSKTKICPQFVQSSQSSEQTASKRFSVRERLKDSDRQDHLKDKDCPGVTLQVDELRDGPNDTATLSFRYHKGLKFTARQRQTHTFVTERRFQPRATNASQSRGQAAR